MIFFLFRRNLLVVNIPPIGKSNVAVTSHPKTAPIFAFHPAMSSAVTTSIDPP